MQLFWELCLASVKWLSVIQLFTPALANGYRVAQGFGVALGSLRTGLHLPRMDGDSPIVVVKPPLRNYNFNRDGLTVTALCYIYL